VSVTPDSLGSYLFTKRSMLGTARSGAEGMRFQAMDPKPTVRRMHKQFNFIPCANQAEARKKVESATYYFHNFDEHDPNGIRRCFLIDINPISEMLLAIDRFEIICDLIAPGERSSSGVFEHIEDISATDGMTFAQLEKYFLEPVSLWELHPKEELPKLIEYV
jgi:hypothetical protein